MQPPVAPAHPFHTLPRFLRRHSLLGYFLAMFLLLNLAFLFLGQSPIAYQTKAASSSLYLLGAFNIFLLLLYALVRHEYVLPAERILAESNKLNGQHPCDEMTLSFRHTAEEFSQFVNHALTLADDRNQLLNQLNDAHTHIRILMHGQQGLCHQTLKESQHLFSTIDTYADYLEELVASDLVQDGVRYDYDEVMEASHNLRFLIQGMISVVQIESQSRPLKRQHTDVALLLSRYMMLLTPALERRAMRFNSSQCHATLPLTTDESLLGHVLWALLTTCLHYADDDSCLNIEGASSADTVRLRFYVNICSPERLSRQERNAYLTALTETDEQVHMFCHTMQHYPNMQLAQRLVLVLGGTVECIPENDYRCVLLLTLPLA